MNQKKIIELDINNNKVLFIAIPYSYKNFKIVQYAISGTYIMESDGKSLNHWKKNIPRGDYDIIGRSHELRPKLVVEKLSISFKDYISVLNNNDITINYSDTSDFWLVVILK